MPDAFIDLGFARVDTDRRRRCGFPEVIFAEGKTAPQVAGIAQAVLQDSPVVLITRARLEHFEAVARDYPTAVWYERSRCITVQTSPFRAEAGKWAWSVREPAISP